METTIFGRGADHQGKAAGAKARHIGTRPAHDLAAYAGDYENAAFGVMSIREEGGALHGRGAAWARSWCIGTMRPLNCLGSKTDCCNPARSHARYEPASGTQAALGWAEFFGCDDFTTS
jgi:hypothetical protein